MRNVTIRIIPALETGWIILLDGYQWGDNPALFDHRLGCSTQVYKSRADARLAIKTQFKGG